MSTIVVPCSSWRRRTCSCRLARFCGSSPVDGSSRNSTCGVCTSPIATSSRRRWPPESVETGRIACSVRSKASSSSSARAYAAARERPNARPWLTSSSRPRWAWPAALPWPTYPMLRRTSRRSRTTSKPATCAVPDVGSISVVSIRSVVDLPAPLGPRKATSSPWPTSRSRPRTASTVVLWRVKCRVRPWVRITGSNWRVVVMAETLEVIQVSSCPQSELLSGA